MLDNITVSPSPHISKAHSTRSIMLDVVIGLAFPMVAAVIFFRLQAVYVIATCVISCMLTEWICNIIRKKPNTLGDLSAVVTGIILAFSLPASIPLWAAAVGGAVAIGIGKMVFGGLGSNIFNPAMVARTFMAASLGGLMVTWTVPATINQQMPDIEASLTAKADAVTQATPLGWSKQAIKAKQAQAKAKNKAEKADNPQAVAKYQAQMEKAVETAQTNIANTASLRMPGLLGGVGGCLGETSALAMLLGGIYMLFRKTITYVIPTAVLGSAAVFAAIFWSISPEKYADPLFHLLSGGMLMCAIFIATDPVTAPLTRKGMWIFGIGIGVVIVLIRNIGGYPEGVMFAVLLMNALSPLIERMCKLVPSGGKKMIKNFIEKSWLLIVASLAFGLLLAGTNEKLDPMIKAQQALKFSKLAGAMIDGADKFEDASEKPIIIKSAKGKDIEVKTIKKGVDKDGKTLGWAFEAVGSGFSDKIKLVIGVDAEFKTIKGFGVLSSNETPGFGDKITKPDHKFVTQFAGTPADELTLSKIGDYGKIDTEIIAISGATITSDAVVSIFNTYIGQVRAALKEKGLL